MAGSDERHTASVQHAPGGGASADVTAWPEFHNGVATGALKTHQWTAPTIFT